MNLIGINTDGKGSILWSVLLFVLVAAVVGFILLSVAGEMPGGEMKAGLITAGNSLTLPFQAIAFAIVIGVIVVLAIIINSARK